MNFDAINIEEIREQLQNPKYYQVHRFTYDYVFNEKSNQQEVYEVAAKQAIDSTLKVLDQSKLVLICRVTIRQYLHMDRLELERPLLWKEIMKEVQEE